MEYASLGRLAPNVTQNVDLPAKVLKTSKGTRIFVHLQWENFDSSLEEKEFEFELEAQKDNIDWEKLSGSESYSLEPVQTSKDLIGRQEILNRLFVTDWFSYY